MARWRHAGHLASGDGLDQQQGITAADGLLFPVLAGHNLAVECDGIAGGGSVKLEEQLCQCQRVLRQRARFAVERDGGGHEWVPQTEQ
ncbi:hypothetical protein ZBT109_1919 [Zymobacter palmae]|uniref:Uncharacterized protein n=1 Tax=Zymobacter palmae TaxID=33074 RepID=A0A348HGB3_9GAMM|nr:hypothetical protein ZBT109_1919 [Zymobacter palmae]